MGLFFAPPGPPGPLRRTGVKFHRLRRKFCSPGPLFVKGLTNDCWGWSEKGRMVGQGRLVEFQHRRDQLGAWGVWRKGREANSGLTVPEVVFLGHHRASVRLSWAARMNLYDILGVR